MAVEVPKEIFDHAIHTQLANLRFSNKVSRDVIALLNAADIEILAKIEATGGDFTKRRLAAVLKEIRKINSETYAQAHNEMKTAMLDFGAVAVESTVAMMATQLPMSWSPFTVSREQLQAIVSDTPITVGADGKLLLEEIFEGLAAGKEKDIRGAIRLSMVEGEGVPDMVRRLRGTKAAQYKDGVLEVSRRHAATMARTITQHTSNQAVQALYENNSNVVKGHTVIVTLDSHTCEKCFPWSGKTFKLNEGPKFPIHPACRCFYLPELKTWRELGVDIDEMPPSFRASAGGLVKSDISFSDWLKGAGTYTQKAVLGPTRQKLFTDGKLQINKFVDDKGSFITLDELKKDHASAFKKAFGS